MMLMLLALFQLPFLPAQQNRHVSVGEQLNFMG
jgi:hypothetical protein